MFKALIAKCNNSLYSGANIHVMNASDNTAAYFIYGREYLCITHENKIVIFDQNKHWVTLQKDKEDTIHISFVELFEVIKDNIVVESQTELDRLANRVLEQGEYKSRCERFMNDYKKLVSRYKFKENHDYTVKELIPKSLENLFAIER